MKKLITICLITFTLFSCNSDEVILGYNLDASLNISVTGSNGHDLLDPANSDALDQTRIRIFYLVKGKLISGDGGGSDNPRSFMIYKQDNHNVMRIFLNNTSEEQYPETYIQWTENNTDKIKIEYNRTNNSVTKKTVWLNDQIKTEIEPYLKIVK